MTSIPEIEEPKIYKDISFKDSKFVELKSDQNFQVDMQYSKMNIKNFEKKCFIREEVYYRLLLAKELLPKGLKIKIWDAWRPFALQSELYKMYSGKLIKDFKLEKCEDRNKIIRKFISEPIEDKNLPPVHTTGGAVDVTLINEKDEELDMGTGFDEFTIKTFTSYFEKTQEIQVRENRRILYNAMIAVGFTNLPSEWWHFDYGDRFWGYYKKHPAIYRGVFTKYEMDR